MKLVLASGSAARLALLRAAGIEPDVYVSGVDEQVPSTMSTEESVVVLAGRKANAVRGTGVGGLILGCDSLLELDGASVGKTESAAEALEVWRRLQGATASLHTGHHLVDTASGGQISLLSTTILSFALMTSDEIEAYVGTGEPLGLAGAICLEGRGGAFIERIEGDPSTVMGLSIPGLRRMLAALDHSIVELWSGPT